MNYNEEYKRWLTSATADADVAAELKAIENDPNYCVYVKRFTPRIKKLIETLYPDIIPLIPEFNERS